MKSHAELGEHILTQFVDGEDILQMVRHHQEHHRCSGYPGGLNGQTVRHERQDCL